MTGEAAMSRGAVMKWLYGYVRANNLNVRPRASALPPYCSCVCTPTCLRNASSAAQCSTQADTSAPPLPL